LSAPKFDSWHCRHAVAANVFRLCVRAGFLALHSIRRTALQLYEKLSYEARNPRLRQTAVMHRRFIICGVKSLSVVDFAVIVVSVCVLAYFLFSEGKEIFIHFLSGWKGGSSFANFDLCVGFLRFANVLTPVFSIVNF